MRLKCAQVHHHSPAGTFTRVPGRCLRWSPTPLGPRWSPAIIKFCDKISGQRSFTFAQTLRTHTQTHTQTHTHTHPPTHARIRTRTAHTHTHTRTRTGTGTSTRTHTYAHSWSRLTFSYLVLILRKTLGGMGWARMFTFTHTHLRTFLITSNFLTLRLDATANIVWGGAGC